MPIPMMITTLNRRVLNPLMRRAVGIGPLGELEHVGRRSGLVRRTPIMAFRTSHRVTVALTYGPNVDWLKNLEVAGTGRLRLGRQELVLGAPARIPESVGMTRMPVPVRGMLTVLRVVDFVEFPIEREGPVRCFT